MSVGSRSQTSEDQLQSELNLPRSRSGSRDQTRRGTDGAVRKNNRVRCAEIGAVEQVEELGPKLQSRLLGHCGVLEQGQIQVSQTRPCQRSTAKVTVGARGRQNKRVR